jgi:hypothetical protein
LDGERDDFVGEALSLLVVRGVADVATKSAGVGVLIVVEYEEALSLRLKSGSW